MKNTYKSTIVKIGEVQIGGENPVVLQSMTNTDTLNLELTVEQCIRIINAGGELVRITAQGIKEAFFLEKIKEELEKNGYYNPIIADIHFSPKAADIAAQKIEKVRINPGNYIDKNNDKKQSFTDTEYKTELNKIEQNFLPLIKTCSKHNTAIRIGSNHGSLSNRILDKYGDTPKGMVEAAMEFIRICNKENFHKIVISMKSSNPKVMVYSTRLLIKTMLDENMNYPIHLGVTEAGNGEEGRIKSALGIGALLIDGIGDTIRVSLTEEPEKEIPVAKQITEHYKNNRVNNLPFIENSNFNFFDYNKRITNNIKNIGGDAKPIIIQNITEFNTEILLKCNYQIIDGFWEKTDNSPDYLFVENIKSIDKTYEKLDLILDDNLWRENFNQKNNIFPKFSVTSFLQSNIFHDKLNFIDLKINEITDNVISKLKSNNSFVGILNINNNSITDLRNFFTKLTDNKCNIPIIIYQKYSVTNLESLQIKSAGDFGSLLIDGLGDGIFIKNNFISINEIVKLSFGILQT